jgi:hypothetical protein
MTNERREATIAANTGRLPRHLYDAVCTVLERLGRARGFAGRDTVRGIGLHVYPNLGDDLDELDSKFQAARRSLDRDVESTVLEWAVAGECAGGWRITGRFVGEQDAYRYGAQLLSARIYHNGTLICQRINRGGWYDPEAQPAVSS